MPADLDLTKQIYSLLEANVFFGDRLKDRQMATLLSPGQFVSDQLDLSAGDDAYVIWELTNKALEASFLYKPKLTTVSGVFKNILEGAALPKVALTQKQEVALETARRHIKRWFSEYRKYQKLWFKADMDWSGAIERRAPSSEIVYLSRQRDMALDDWINNGFKNEYESAKGVEYSLTSLDPERSWRDLAQQFAQSEAQSSQGNYWRTGLIPEPRAWSSAGWAHQTIAIKDTYQYDYSRSTHFDAGASGGWGLWSVGGNYSKDEQWQRSASRSSDLSISFEWLLVEISRPWLQSDVLDARYWRWKKGAANTLLSDGGNLQPGAGKLPEPPRGAFPMLPTHWFLTKNVEISGAWSQADMEFHASQIQAGASVGWGPWSVHGNYSESSSERTATSHFDGMTLKVPQPQILAVLGTLLPRMPNPSPDLNWQANAELGEPSYPSLAKELVADRARRADEFIRRLAVQQAIHTAAMKVENAFEEDSDQATRKYSDRLLSRISDTDES